MIIKGIIHCRNGSARLYTTSALTMNTMRTSILTKGTVYLYLGIDDRKQVIDFTRLCIDNGLAASAANWDDIVTVLNVINISDYAVDNIPIPSFVTIDDSGTSEPAAVKQGLSLIGTHQINIIPVASNPNIEVHYGNKVNQTLNDKYYARAKTSDVFYTFNKANIVNINNTVPVCNGYFCYPSISNNALYATGGAHLCKNTSDRDAGHLLVDFSPAGQLECIKLSSCTGTASRFSLPSGKTMKGKFVLLVLDGHLFTPGEFDRLSTRTIAFNLNKFTTAMEVDKLQCQYKFNYNTGLLTDTLNRDLMQRDNSFLIMVNAAMTVAYHEPIMRISDNVFKFPGYVGGLAIDLSTKTIVDYSRIQYGGKHFVKDFVNYTPDEAIATSHDDLVSDRYSVLQFNRQNWGREVLSSNNYMCKHSITYSSRKDLDVFDHSIEHRVILLDFMFN